MGLRSVYYKSKHAEFEALAKRFGVKSARTKEVNLKGVLQHVVLTSKGGVLRWPVNYEYDAHVIAWENPGLSGCRYAEDDSPMEMEDETPQ